MDFITQLKLTFELAVQGLATNKGRTMLTTIGIIIGISVIVIVLSSGRALERFILEQIEIFGADTIEVEIKVPNVSDVEMLESLLGGAEITTLKVDDFEVLTSIPNIDTYYAATMGQFKTVYENNSLRSFIWATTAGFPEVDTEAKLAKGRFFTDREEKSQAKVVVIGSKIKEDLFGQDEALGKSIKINQVSFKVIGVAEERGGFLFFNYDKMIFMPLKTAQKQLMGIDHVLFGFLTVNDITKADETVAEINAIMRERHNLPPNDINKDDFRTTSMAEAMEIVGTVTIGMTLLVLAVAGISLVVGGVGIMNIMYLTVLERTREIGLRKALGASNSIIKNQFLIEALLITGIGGVIGIVLGTIVILFIDLGARLQGFNFALVVTWDAILLGFISSLIFGILFGLYPARKAASLKPVEALRYE